MSNPPSKVLQDLLVTGSIVQTSDATADWFSTRSMMADSPNRCVTLYDYAGGNPDPKWNIDNPSVQCVIRGNVNDYDLCWSKAKEVKDALLGIMSQDIDGDRWISISMRGDINFLGRDDTSRPRLSVNFSILKESALNAGASRELL